MTDFAIPETMKAVVVREVGGPDSLSFETDYPVPSDLAEGQVLIKNQYTGLNFIDTYYRTGLYKQQVPFISGQEGAGVVVKKHESVADLKVGDVVVYSTLGTYCDYTRVPAKKVIKLPEGVSMEDALCGMVQGLTAHYLVTDGTGGLTKKGDWMLMYSVGSGTCQWACQLAKIKGYKIIGTTSQSKITEAAQSACDHLIVLETAEGKSYADYDSVDIHAKVMEITEGAGVKCIVDGVGKSTAETSVKCLARRGLWISFGNASGAVPPFSLLKLTPKSGFVTRPKLGDYVATKEELQSRADEIFSYLADGTLTVKVDKVLPLEEAKDGHIYLESGKSNGKILFKI
eukprot:CAMPEP_0116131758 /NCGR_PEP_ID=MMETSP0329-20121206/9180_1 /TAXON_ID=697910 /ORGANISM="Pseudo-nitzschia arenysensis, Strain B593" /LENGTH=343 /DNA_ID=CAMNT_0003626217 /DNA_START=120 /DNA_END=1151 /DNA_ORIENTATION=-